MRLLILAFLAYILYRVLRRYLGPGPETRAEKFRRGRDGGVIDEMVQDPVCKTYIPSRDAKKRVIDGKAYLFCSDQCADEFEKQQAAKRSEG
jgi:YHS domain-containing protein